MADTRVSVAAEVVRQRIAALKVTFPDLLEDVELLEATIEGETDFDSVMARIVNEALESEALSEGLHEYMGRMRERRDRLIRKNEAMRALAFGLMRAADKDVVTLPVATLSIRKPLPRVVVDDPADLPQGYVEITRKPLVTAIKNALKNGDAIPGARLEAGEPSLAIRSA